MRLVSLPLLLAALLPACAEPVSEGAFAIIGGTPTTGDPAVVMLVSHPTDLSTFDACTASLIAPDVLLTAAHCLDPAKHPGYVFGAFTGPDASAFPTAATLAPKLVSVKETHIHPDYDPNPPFFADIGVAILAAPLDVTPIPVNRAPLDASLTGTAARIVGYGQIKYGDFNAIKHEATTALGAVDDDTVIVGDGMRRSCVGDSGGPALVKVDGIEIIVGVDSYTDTAGCLEPAHYRRTDVHAAFLDTYAPPAPPATDGGVDAGVTADAGEPEVTEPSGCSVGAPVAGGEASCLLAAMTAIAGAMARRRRHGVARSRDSMRA
ncbi:Vitamin K-dependent protein C [Minicystis rosea]|nr:Vitamin K-dependent protein C [Minicystis rosea]